MASQSQVVNAVCTACGHTNRHGVLVCEECGAHLVKKTRGAMEEALSRALPPHVLNLFQNMDDAEETVLVNAQARDFHAGTSVFERTMLLRLEFIEVAEVLLLNPMEGEPLILGRKDNDDQIAPDIDLLPYGGYQKGISRRHAKLSLRGKRVEICDLGSSNGTYLNDVLLDADEPHQLRDNDVLRLGNMTLWVNFQK